jgi:uncharacterized membrane protein YhiD involved in acid resistance
MPQELAFPGAAAPLELTTLLINLAVGVVLSLLLRYHFKTFGSTLSNREEFAQVFPFILLTTALIITIVKSSLALSLGLVGALSIVRFRTPIKEPEELAYLFLAIAMGLGLGANQTIPTIVAGLSILGIMAAIGQFKKSSKSKNVYLSLDWRSNGESDERPEEFLSSFNDIVAKHTRRCDLRRFDVRDGALEITYFIDAASDEILSSLTEELRRTFPTAGVTFLDQNQLPGV